MLCCSCCLLQVEITLSCFRRTPVWERQKKLYLHNSHVQPRLWGQLLSDVACRFGWVFVGTFEGLQLLGSDGGPRSFGTCLWIVCKTPLQAWVTSSYMCHVVLTGSGPSAFARRIYVLNEVHGHVWKCIIVLVHLSHSHSRGHKFSQCQGSGVIGAAPYKSIASLYIINQMHGNLERRGTHTHTRSHRWQTTRTTVRNHFTALQVCHVLYSDWQKLC